MFLRLSELQSRSSSAPQWGGVSSHPAAHRFIRVFPQGCGSAGRCLNGRPPLAIRPHFHQRAPAGLEFQRSHPP